MSGLVIHGEALLAAGYAVLLVLTAIGLERFGRWSARPARRSGPGTPVDWRGWECPTREHPWPVIEEAPDPESPDAAWSVAYTCRPLHEYRGSVPGTLGVDHPAGSWPHVEVVRFHDVLALVLITLAGVVAGIGLVRHPRVGEIVMLGLVLGLVGLAGWRRLRGLFATRIEIPGVTRLLPWDENLPR